MTRFARAKGSKASNEKLENEPTPWHVMKQQLEESSEREEFMKEKTKTARQLLEEREISTTSNTDWAEFEKPKVSEKASKINASSKIEKSTEKNIKKKKLKESFQKQKENNSDLVEEVSEKIKVKNQVLRIPEKVEKVEVKVKRTKSLIEPSKESTPALKRKKFNQTGDENETREDRVSKKKKKKNVIPQTTEENSLPVSKKSKVKPTERLRNETIEDKVPKGKKKKNVISEKSEENSLPVSEESKAKPTERLSKRQKRNLKKKNQNLVVKNNESGNKNLENRNKKSSNSVFDTDENDWNTDVKFGNSNTEKKPEPVKLGANISEKGIKNLNQFNQERFGRPNMKNHHLRTAKSRDDKEHQRRKPMNSTKLFINGMEIEVVMCDGFPIQKEDAERLHELKQKMVLKGIPKSEIDAAMKLERRKAEKSLARVRKQVCFHCRKAGHNLSDCPELGMEESVTGICFKCGSGEHTHFECKVTKSDDYRFATCFICREAGHIAKQCPDNPRGLYPKGGGCKMCGDVTHLQKDCPDKLRKKEETTITVKTIAETALESLEEEGKKIEPKKEPKQKIVKF